jgi:hypothetical protein
MRSVVSRMSRKNLEIPFFYGLRNDQGTQRIPRQYKKFRSEEKAQTVGKRENRQAASSFSPLEEDAYSWYVDLDYNTRRTRPVWKDNRRTNSRPRNPPPAKPKYQDCQSISVGCAP